jgi:hypothetical protein
MREKKRIILVDENKLNNAGQQQSNDVACTA